MTLTELKYLVALDKERHFGRAAERCFVSQPTLSVALRKLEERLNVPLFERVRGEAKPTPVGERIIDQARKVLSEAAQLESIAKSSQDELEGPLRLGVIYTVGPYLLPHLIPALRQHAPRMPLVIEETFTANLDQQLRENELDAIIISLPFEPAGVSTQILYEEPFVVVMPAEHDWASRKSINPNDLAGENLLLLGSGHCFRDQVLSSCPDCIDHDEQRALGGGSLETIRHMVASGLGITVLPASSVMGREADPLMVQRPFSGDSPRRQVALAWRNSFTRGGAIDAVSKAISDCDIPGTQHL